MLRLTCGSALWLHRSNRTNESVEKRRSESAPLLVGPRFADGLQLEPVLLAELEGTAPTKTLDASALKRFSLSERKYLQIRFETFNITPRRIQMGARLVW